MSEPTILVIDDSATIRKLVDTHLSPAGYRVVLAPNAEEGLKQAREIRPDLILLDHQLPGTTGFEVCRQLIETPQLREIPVVVSSTLRKRAYVEYADSPNVVDMLPKPYTEDLLRTTIKNALDTAAMVVASQAAGTAVPEVISELGEGDLHGSFASFGLREVLDFLNNGNQRGVLEVEAEQMRLWFYLDEGRIRGVTTTGIGEQDIDEMTQRLPEALHNLAPVLKLTIRGRGCAEVDGLVQLLDRKVLDPRLMMTLLRYQAAMLVRLAFTRKLIAFRFESGASPPPLQDSLPLDTSLLALLVQGALHCDESQLPPEGPHQAYVRRALRGQNLDRAGLSARHMKILHLLAEPHSAEDLATHLEWDLSETRRVLHGLILAELAETRDQASVREFILYEPNPVVAGQLRTVLAEGDARYRGKVVRDGLALQLLLKRACPDALVFPTDEASLPLIRKLLAGGSVELQQAKRIAIEPVESAEAGSPEDACGPSLEDFGLAVDETLPRPYTAELLFQTLDRLFPSPKQTHADDRPAEYAASPQSCQTDVHDPVPAGAV